MASICLQKRLGTTLPADIANTAIEVQLQQIQASPLASRNTVHIQYLRHQFVIWGENRLSLFLLDPTHLNQHGLRKYFYSIRTSASAVIFIYMNRNI